MSQFTWSANRELISDEIYEIVAARDVLCRSMYPQGYHPAILQRFTEEIRKRAAGALVSAQEEWAL